MTEVESNLSTDLDSRIAELSEFYLPLAASILRECIRIPADYVDLPADEGGDPASGLSGAAGDAATLRLAGLVLSGFLLSVTSRSSS